MLIHFFRKSYLFQYIVLILIALALWIGTLVNPSVILLNTDSFLTPGYSLLLSLLHGNQLLQNILAIVLVISSALLFNTALTKFDMVPKNTLVPAMVYIVLGLEE